MKPGPCLDRSVEGTLDWAHRELDSALIGLLISEKQKDHFWQGICICNIKGLTQKLPSVYSLKAED